MAKVTIKDLLEAGVHFGHQTKRWNPKMKHFVYGAKNGISIIDLTKTMRQIADACNFLQHRITGGGKVLFVGTKRQAQQLIKESAEKTGMFYVTERWLGGTLTNNVTIRKSIEKMRESDKILAAGTESSMKKKELSAINRKAQKLHRDLDGIADMKHLPAVMLVVDVCHNDIAVCEARKLNIPIVGIVDTNGDPELVDYPIAANDDAVRSIKIILDVLVDAIGVGTELHHKKVIEDQSRLEAEKAAKAADGKDKDDEKKDASSGEQKDDTRKPRRSGDRPFQRRSSGGGSGDRRSRSGGNSKSAPKTDAAPASTETKAE